MHSNPSLPIANVEQRGNVVRNEVVHRAPEMVDNVEKRLDSSWDTRWNRVSVLFLRWHVKFPIIHIYRIRADATDPDARGMFVDSRWLIAMKFGSNVCIGKICFIREWSIEIVLSFIIVWSNFKFCRPGVQLQQIDRGRGELPRFALRLRLHHALREKHVFKGNVFRYDLADGSAREKEARDWAEASTKRRGHRSDQSSLQMLQ